MFYIIFYSSYLRAVITFSLSFSTVFHYSPRQEFYNIFTIIFYCVSIVFILFLVVSLSLSVVLLMFSITLLMFPISFYIVFTSPMVFPLGSVSLYCILVLLGYSSSTDKLILSSSRPDGPGSLKVPSIRLQRRPRLFGWRQLLYRGSFQLVSSHFFQEKKITFERKTYQNKALSSKEYPIRF